MKASYYRFTNSSFGDVLYRVPEKGDVLQVVLKLGSLRGATHRIGITAMAKRTFMKSRGKAIFYRAARGDKNVQEINQETFVKLMDASYKEFFM